MAKNEYLESIFKYKQQKCMLKSFLNILPENIEISDKMENIDHDIANRFFVSKQ